MQADHVGLTADGLTADRASASLLTPQSGHLCWLDGLMDSGWVDRVNKWMKRHWSFDCISSAFVWTTLLQELPNCSQCHHLKAIICSVPPSPRLSPKKILSYSFPPSETCDFPLLFVSKAPQSWVPTSSLVSFSLIPPLSPAHQRQCIIHHRLSLLCHFTSCWIYVCRQSEWSIFLPCLADCRLSFKTYLGYLYCGTLPQPEFITPFFVFMGDFISYT